MYGMCAHASKNTYNERCGNLGCVYNVVGKDGENNLTVGNIGQTISQTFALGQNMIKFEHDGF
jgi:hypothetical protein